MARKVIFFDGIMCVGKTSVIRQLISEIPGSISLPEVLEFLRAMESDSFEFYINNDNCKLTIAATVEAEYILVDRSFISTLAYSASFPNFSWERLDALYSKLIIPRLQCTFILIEEDPIKSIERAQALGRNLLNRWGDVGALQLIVDAYRKLFDDLPNRLPDVTTLRLRSTHNVEEVSKQVQQVLGQLYV